MRFQWILLSAAVVACRQPAVASPDQAASSEVVVTDFMRAVADSNISKMAMLWGSSKGPAGVTKQPEDYVRRLVVMQAYLRGATYRVASADPASPSAERRTLNLELLREGCARVAPFVTVKSARGWLVNSVDLVAVGTPGRVCETPKTDSLR